MRRLISIPLLVAAMGACGCGTQQILLETQGPGLLTAFDALVVPGRPVALRARFQVGDMLKPAEGYVVLFRRDGVLFKAGETNREGIAQVHFTPNEPGDYVFTAEVCPVGLAGDPPEPQRIFVACRKRDEPIAIIDLDRTLVATGFQTVLVGDPQPMAGSQEVLRRLSETYTIVYLTHRPDYFGPKSRSWLDRKGYPRGPVLLSSIGEFFAGSGRFKRRKLAELAASFDNIRIGIGDKVSDAIAYHDAGLEAFLIVQIPPTEDPDVLDRLADSLRPLPSDVQVVTGWDQIDRVIDGSAVYPRRDMQAFLRRDAERLRTRADVGSGAGK